MAAMLVKLRALTICQNWPTGRVNLKILCHYLSELADRTAQFVNIMLFLSEWVGRTDQFVNIVPLFVRTGQLD